MDIFLNFAMFCIGVLTLLVTALITWQIWNDFRLRRKVREVAINSAKDVMDNMVADFSFLTRGNACMRNASLLVGVPKADVNNVDSIMNALLLFRKCEHRGLSDPAIDDAMKELDDIFEYEKKEGGIVILKGKRDIYRSAIGHSHRLSEKLQESLSLASEYQPEE